MGALMQVKSVNNKIIMKDFKAQKSINAKKINSMCQLINEKKKLLLLLLFLLPFVNKKSMKIL